MSKGLYAGTVEEPEYKLGETLMTKRNLAAVMMGALLVLLAGCAFASAAPPDFEQIAAFPDTGSVAAVDALRDGTFVAFDGDAIWVETARRSGEFSELVSGFDSEAGFLAASPDGRTLLVGAAGEIYIVDTRSAEEGLEPVAAIDGVWAEFIARKLALVDQATDEGSQLVLVDLNTAGLSAVVLEKTGAPAALAASGRFVYAADGDSGEVRSFKVADLISARDAKAALTWEDGVEVGFYNTGGVSAVSPRGTLLVGGVGAVQFVDTDGEVVGEVNAGDDAETLYAAVYNERTGRVLIAGVNENSEPVTAAWTSTTSYEPLGFFARIFQFIQNIIQTILRILGWIFPINLWFAA